MHRGHVVNPVPRRCVTSSDCAASLGQFFTATVEAVKVIEIAQASLYARVYTQGRYSRVVEGWISPSEPPNPSLY